MCPVQVSESVDIVSVGIAGVMGLNESLCEMRFCVSEPSVGDKCRS